MALITYANKQSMGTQPSIPDDNKVMDSDLNQIKTAINDSTTYSTTEKVVGEWIDGKPLYSKTFTFTDNHTTNNSTVEVNHAHNLTNVDTIFIDQGHSFAVSGDTSFILGRTYISNSNIAITMSAIVNATNIRTEIFYKGSISFTFTITVNYTKTTD